MAKILIIGYGNSLRGDDRAGQLVAGAIKKQNRQNIKCLALQQLTPELAAEISRATKTIFVDAVIARESQFKKVVVKPLETKLSTQINNGHIGDPVSLLSLSKIIYNQTPLAWLVLIPAVNFEFSNKLSALTKQGIKEAIAAIEKLIK